MGRAAGEQAKTHERKEPKNTKAKDNLLSKSGTGAVTVKRVVRAAEAFVRRDKPLIGRDGSGDGKARNHVAPNVKCGAYLTESFPSLGLYKNGEFIWINVLASNSGAYGG